MNIFLCMGKGLMLLIWTVLITNIFWPFPGKAAMAFYLLTGFVVFLHLIQFLIFYGAFGEKLQLRKREVLSIFTFGVFSLWGFKERL